MIKASKKEKNCITKYGSKYENIFLLKINTKILDLFLFSFQMQTAAMTHIMPEIMKSNNDELRDIINYFLIY